MRRLAAVLFFILAGLAAVILISVIWFRPRGAVIVVPILGYKTYLLIRYGFQFLKQDRIRKSSGYLVIETAVKERAYEGATIEDVIHGLPPELRLISRTKTVGFLRGSFRFFERLEFEGLEQTVFVDCIGGRVAGKRISMRVPGSRSRQAKGRGGSNRREQ